MDLSIGEEIGSISNSASHFEPIRITMEFPALKQKVLNRIYLYYFKDTLYQKKQLKMSNMLGEACEKFLPREHEWKRLANDSLKEHNSLLWIFQREKAKQSILLLLLLLLALLLWSAGEDDDDDDKEEEEEVLAVSIAFKIRLEATCSIALCPQKKYKIKKYRHLKITLS